MTFLAVHVDTVELYLTLFFAGVVTHVIALRKGEWDLWAMKFLGAWIFYETALPLLLSQYGSVSYLKALLITNKSSIAFLTGLTSSILAYRSFFHRLNRFPGPFVARLSNVYATVLANKEEHMYEEVQKLHHQYGDIVRIGPSEISIANPQAFRILHANNSPVSKGPFYNVAHPWINLLADRNKKRHGHRRKAWDKAFTAKALRDYEHRVVKYTKQLTEHIDEMKGRPFNLTKWINFYTFDIMGDLAFGKSFDMLVNGVEHEFLKLSHTSQTVMGILRRAIWLFPVFKAIPFLNSDYLTFQSYLVNQVDDRRKNPPVVPDVFSWLLEDFSAKENPTKQDYLNLYGDAHLIVIAGSDTTAASTTCLLYQLALHPEVYSQLQTEIDDYKERHEQSDHYSLSQLKYLQACIDEALRLHPVITSGLQRMTPPEGMQLDDVFIPGDTIFHAPSYTMYRDERCFARPSEFLPERWTSEPDLVKDSSVYAPFSVGRGACAGKQLGLMEMRYVLTEILSQYNIALAPGTDPQAFEDGLRDCFTLELPKLDMVFTPRARTGRG
ncbi:hypothetical protein FSARC_13196 [Fusarium sarcochroum]|uniref:Cytochrome P450 monooxygenase n=1 Tax=Fusarium sarcochroum TaxID=1208366 RepID=A0A8H4T3B3_9HYPO|nr:hypothetical protein FSARC_13196 [Fusarium sarcochroum]